MLSAFAFLNVPLNILLLSGVDVVDAIAAASRRAGNAQQVLIIGRARIV